MKMQEGRASRSHRGRRPAGSGTRDAILAAAKDQFGAHGYRGTTLRSIGQAAAVDPRLVTHYFGSKAGLFRESVAFPPQVDERMAAAFEQVRAGRKPGRQAAQAVVSLIEDVDARQAMVGLIRAASSEPEAAELIRDVLTESKLLPFAAAVGGSAGGLRASFVASQIVGLTMARYVVRIGPLAAASPEQLVEALTPVFDHYLTGDWVMEGPA